MKARATLHVAIVCAIDGARFAAVAGSEPECLAQVAAYVAEHAAEQLWPATASRIHKFFAAGDLTATITEYFGCSGERWDAEWLVTARLPGDGRFWSGAVPFPKSRGGSPPLQSSGQGSSGWPRDYTLPSWDDEEETARAAREEIGT